MNLMCTSWNAPEDLNAAKKVNVVPCGDCDEAHKARFTSDCFILEAVCYATECLTLIMDWDGQSIMPLSPGLTEQMLIYNKLVLPICSEL